MSVTVPIYVEGITSSGTVVVDGTTYNAIRLYRSDEPDGTFTQLTSTSLVASQEIYEITDSTGDSSYYYYYTFFNTSTLAESGHSEISATTGTQLRRLRFEAAIHAHAASRGTCSANGGSLTLVDEALKDEGVDDDYAAGVWIYRPDVADEDDRCRRVKESGFDDDTGTLSVSRSWGTPPTSGERYQLFKMMPPVDQPGQPYSWSRAVRDGLNCLRYTDEINLGEGDNTQTRFDLSTFVHSIVRGSVNRVWLRTTDTNGYITDINAGKNLGFWKVRENGPHELTLQVEPAPSTDQTIIVEAMRRYAPVYNDTDVTLCPFELAWRAGLYAAYRHINRAQSGKYAFEMADSLAELKKELPNHNPPHAVIV